MEVINLVIKVLLLVQVAGMADKLKDLLKDKFWLMPEWIKDRQGFWNPVISWKNKHKERGNTWIANLIEKLDNAQLTMFTDAWHLLKEVSLQCYSWTLVILFYEVYPTTWYFVLLYAFVARGTFFVGFIIYEKMRYILLFTIVAIILLTVVAFTSWGMEFTSHSFLWLLFAEGFLFGLYWYFFIKKH